MSSVSQEQMRLFKLLKWQEWKENANAFVKDCVWTRDEADNGSIKRMPEKEYLFRIGTLFQREKILLIPKSRRMMMTWWCLAMCLWRALFFPNQTIFVQSKKMSDSAYLLGDDRIIFMYNKLLRDIHDFPKILRKNRDNESKGYASIHFDNGSSIVAVAEGPDQLRQYTASMVYCTEMAFWSSARLTWIALRPVIQGGGKILIDSSANPGFFREIVEGSINDEEKDQDNVVIDDGGFVTGITEYKRNGAYIARVHYTADPDKRSEEWMRSEKAGADSAGWEREMEINFNVSVEKPFYSEFKYDLHVAKKPLNVIEARPMIASLDYGLTPATVFAQTNAKGQLIFLRELQSVECGMRNHAKVMMSEIATYYPNHKIDYVGDPAGNQRSQVDERTANELLREEFGISVMDGALSLTERSEAVRWFLTTLTPDGEPMAVFDPRLSIIIGGFTGGYHRKQIGDRILDEPDKNEFSHLIDCVSYICAYIYRQRGRNSFQDKYNSLRKAGKIRKAGRM